MANLTDAEYEAQEIPCKRGTWKISAMREAFNRVAPRDNWKLAIKATVAKADLDLTLDAIEFHCGGGAEATGRIGRRIVVSHPGYYAVIGA